MSASRI